MVDYADVVIVGAGAGGATLGGELAEAGAKVVFLESGNDLDITYGSPNHFANSQEFLDVINIKMINDGLFWHEEYEGRIWNTDMGECAGGGTTTYGGVLEPSTPLDYDNWPISWDEFQPYFDLTNNRYHIYRWPMSELSHYAKVINEASGGIMGPLQTGFNREPYFEYGVYHDRCRKCRCCILGCRYNAKSNALTVTLPKARWYGSEVRANCLATKLNLNQSGSKVKSLTYLKRTPTGPLTERHEVKTICADKFVLAAGSMMTPMILYWSGKTGQPLCNSSGQVGRNLRGHFLRITFGVLDRDDIRTYQGNALEVFDQYRNFDNGYMLEFNMHSPPTYLGGVFQIMEDAVIYDMIGLKFKRFMRDFGKVCMAAPLSRSYDDLGVGFTSNSISPHPTKKNKYGLPLPVVSFEPNPTEAAWVDAAVAHSQEIMVDAGADSERMFTSSVDVVHKVGTCRMGTNPENSVVDLGGKCHDMENLWISDGSIFPAPLLANCAYVIYALAYKIADGMLNRSTPTS